MAAKTLLILAGLLMVPYGTMTAADVCDTSQLIPCLPAATTNPDPPTLQCCNVIHTFTTECLCTALQSRLAKVEGVDFNNALQLPHKCGRYVPKGTKCGDTAVPNGIEHDSNHHEAVERAMEHQDTMDHEKEHQETIEHGTDHHENQETVELH